VSFAIGDRVLTARLAGPSIGARQTPIIHTEINDVLHSLGPRLKRLVLDLTEVRSMSSMALGMCLDVRKTARRLGIKTAAVGMSHDMAKVLRRLKLADGARPGRMAGILRGAFTA
jgi:anti-anti-sigma factor